MAVKANKNLSFYVSFFEDNNHSVSVNTSTANALDSNAIGYNAYSIAVNKYTNTSIVTVTFNANAGYYYSVPPKAIIKSIDKKNYIIQESLVKGGNNEIIAKTFVINYRGVVTNSKTIDAITFNHKLSVSSVTLNTDTDLKKIQQLKDSLYGVDTVKASIIKKEITETETNLKTNIESNLINIEREKEEYINLQIRNYSIDDSYISASGGSRFIRVFGTPGASYNLTISKCTGTIPCANPDTFYDPGSATFTSNGKGWYDAPINNNGASTLYIEFPSTDETTTYTFKLTPNKSQHFLLGTSNGEFDIFQYPAVTATFSLASVDASAHYNTLPSNVTITRDVNEEGGILDINWDVSLSANSFTLLRQPKLSDFKITTTVNTDDVNDKNANTKVITLDSVENVFVGALVTGSSPFSTSGGTQYITAVDQEEKEITVTSTQNLNDNQTLTFTGYGAEGIRGISGSTVSLLRKPNSIDNIDPTVSLSKVTTTTDTTVSGTTVNIASTNGIKGSITHTVNGNHSGVKTITLNATPSNIGIGHKIIAVSSGSLTGFPKVLSVDLTTKKIVISTPQTFANGITLTFSKTTVKGPGITAPTDTDMVMAEPLPIVKTVNAGVSVVVTNAQTLENGVELEFEGSSRKANIQFQLDIARLGESSFTATLELDNILSVG